ncbi:Uncharacterised protein [Mycobacterium tuberculosis]|uniref:Uncharacterized protein n=1 Tax=Mycobacterium tuberculosis TaxID=1773 RepID=A0A0U0RKN4_MYCTX|nr:Uncharacterised protein [Mycobacterium tuberculosis]COW12657.1 Uncharacterised protein [Mycobacterium tuberculosis]COX71428.1 Uncharacterised protein [Mycobacterium tuberculosis]COY03121.1 Uncharacterised protein [Mycobacterium tuberculosis]COZ55522.1 Uncharacterised protein [Mycobacterium tuberculosis]
MPSGAGIVMRSESGVSIALWCSGNSEPSAATIASRSFRSRGTISQKVSPARCLSSFAVPSAMIMP